MARGIAAGGGARKPRRHSANCAAPQGGAARRHLMNCPQGEGALRLLAPRVPVGGIVICEVFNAVLLHIFRSNISVVKGCAVNVGMTRGAEGYKIVLVVGAALPARNAVVNLDILRAIAERAPVPVTGVNRFTFCVCEIG